MQLFKLVKINYAIQFEDISLFNKYPSDNLSLIYFL